MRIECGWSGSFKRKLIVPLKTRAMLAENEPHDLFLLNPRTQRVSGKNEQLGQTLWRGAPRGAGPNATASFALA